MDAILAFTKTRLTNAISEGLNRVAKIVKNRASGFRTLEPFADLIMLVIIAKFMIPNSPAPDPRLTPNMPIRLIPGVAALMRLGRNYENTTAVLDVYRYMNRSSFDQAVLKFSESKIGIKLLDEPNFVKQALKDVDCLRCLPQNSLGITYLRKLEACRHDAAAVQMAEDKAFDYLLSASYCIKTNRSQTF